MHAGKTVLAQVLDWIHPQQFQRCVARYAADYKVRHFSCWNQFVCLAFAQLTYRESLRDIESCLRSRGPQLYHLGLRGGTVSRSTLADANESRDWRLFADLAQQLLRQARHLYANEDLGVELEQAAYALDSTTVDLCLSLFPWARFRRTRAAVKLHTLLDVRGSLPASVNITDGRTHDVRELDRLAFEPQAIYIMDRGYLDFARLFALDQSGAFFIIRAREHLCYCRCHCANVDCSAGLRADQIISLTGGRTSRAYPDRLRRVSYYDQEQQRGLVFLTNHFALPALSVARLYRLRWRVELFFKWIKQHLRIKAFYGTSPNAVRTQIWVAMAVYALVAIMKKQLKIEASLFEILQVLSVSVFEKVPLAELFTNTKYQVLECLNSNQLPLFNL